jgi:hypothetical protein
MLIQDWKRHKAGCRRVKASQDEAEQDALSNRIIPVDLDERINIFLSAHQAAFSVAINTLFGFTGLYTAPHSVDTHLLVLEFSINPKPQAQHDVLNVLVLDKCYIQSRVDFLLTRHGESERARADINEKFNHKMKKTKHTLVRVAQLYTSKWTGITTFSPIHFSTVPPRYGMTRGYVSHMVLESLQWAYKGPACQSDFEANYRSSLRESRWGIQPRGKSIHYTSGQ